MGRGTGIQWCDDTVNPTTGCDGCELWHVRDKGPCYAGNLHVSRLAKSLPHLYDSAFTNVRLAPGRMSQTARWSDLTGKLRSDKPWLDGMPRMIFVSDMADALSEDVPFQYLFDEIILNVLSGAGRRHLYLWLTKLPHRMAEFARWLRDQSIEWPDNLWAGTSITSQKTVRRAKQLFDVPAKVRFLSVEPMWGPVDLHEAFYIGEEGGWEWVGTKRQIISWVICGGESAQRGFEPRPFDLAWPRSLRDQCRAAGASFFLKQLGPRPIYTVPGPLGLDRRGISLTTNLVLRDSHGGDWNEWPNDLKVRQFPKVEAMA